MWRFVLGEDWLPDSNDKMFNGCRLCARSKEASGHTSYYRIQEAASPMMYSEMSSADNNIDN